MASDLHVAAAGLVGLVDEPGTLEDFSLAVEAVKGALAAEDEAGGPVETPAPEPVAVPVDELAPEAIDVPVSAEAAAAPADEPAPAADPADDAEALAD